MDRHQSDHIHAARSLWGVDDVGKRLLFTVGQEPYNHWWQDMEQYAQRAISEPLPALRFEWFRQFRDDGQRIPYERVYFERRGRLVALAILMLRLRAEQEQTREHQEHYPLEQTDASNQQVSHNPDYNAIDPIYPFQASVVLKELEETIWELCNEYTWCLPAHLPKDSAIPAWQEIDLFTAETAGMLAELFVLLNGVVDYRIIERMQMEIRRRVLDVLVDTERQLGWETAEHNWSAVCASGCGIAALLVERHTGRQQRILKRVIKAMGYFLEGYGDDGGCGEGLGYWVYGFGYFTYLNDMLGRMGYRVEWNESQQRKIQAIASFPYGVHLSGGLFVNFSDSEERQALPTGLLSRLAEQHDLEISLPFAIPLFSQDHCHRWAHVLRDILWSQPERFAHRASVCASAGDMQKEGDGQDDSSGEWQEQHKLEHRKQGTDQTEQMDIMEQSVGMTKAVERENFDGEIAYEPAHTASTVSRYWQDLQWLVVPGEIGFAAKGGHNDEPHNHNDLGSFIVHGGGENLFCDPGAGMYTQAYFAPGREAILHISSAGHSVPSIQGMEQQSGREYESVLLDLQQREQEAVFTLELAGAYPESIGLESFIRRFHWQSEDHRERASYLESRLDLHDCFQLQSGLEAQADGIDIRERFMSRIKPQIGEGYIIWQGERANVHLDTEGMDYAISVEALASQDHEGRPVLFYRTCLRWQRSMDELAVMKNDVDLSKLRVKLCNEEMSKLLEMIHFTEQGIQVDCRFTFTISSHRKEM